MATPLAQASNSSNTANFTRQPQSTKSDVVDLSALQSASRVLLEQLAKDAQIIPDIGETLTTRMPYFYFDSDDSNCFVAGNHASASYSVFPDDIRVPFQKKRFVGIPEGLFQYYDSKHTVPVFLCVLWLMHGRRGCYFAHGFDARNWTRLDINRS